MNINRIAVNERWGNGAWGTAGFGFVVIMLFQFIGVVGALAIQELFGIEDFFSRVSSWIFVAAFVLGGFAAAWKDDGSTLKRSIHSGFVIVLCLSTVALLLSSYAYIQKNGFLGTTVLANKEVLARSIAFIVACPILGAMLWFFAFGSRKMLMNPDESRDSLSSVGDNIKDSALDD